jgi:hypothetical protein
VEDDMGRRLAVIAPVVLLVAALLAPAVDAATTWTARFGSYGTVTLRVGSPDRLVIGVKNLRSRTPYAVTLRRGTCAANGSLVLSTRLTTTSVGSITRTITLTTAQARAAKLPLAVRVGTRCASLKAPVVIPTPSCTIDVIHKATTVQFAQPHFFERFEQIGGWYDISYVKPDRYLWSEVLDNRVERQAWVFVGSQAWHETNLDDGPRGPWVPMADPPDPKGSAFGMLLDSMGEAEFATYKVSVVNGCCVFTKANVVDVTYGSVGDSVITFDAQGRLTHMIVHEYLWEITVNYIMAVSIEPPA